MFCIVYELKNAEKDYSAFYQEIKNMGNSNQFISNGWFVDTNLNKDEIYNILKPQLELPDLLLVTKASLSTMSGFLPSISIEWLKKNEQ
jgi:hypothetical protein